MTKQNLEALLTELGCRTPIKEIPSDRFGIIEEFLVTEMEYRKQHRIKRLLRASGIKQVKTLSQFDWCAIFVFAVTIMPLVSRSRRCARRRAPRNPLSAKRRRNRKIKVFLM